MNKSMNAKQKILNYLQNKENFLTVARARDRLGIQNVAARVEELRQEGHIIYTGTKHARNGRTVRFYHLGQPTKTLVRAAIAAGYSFSGSNRF